MLFYLSLFAFRREKEGLLAVKVSFISANYIPRSARTGRLGRVGGGVGCKTEVVVVVVVREEKLREKKSGAVRLKEKEPRSA